MMRFSDDPAHVYDAITRSLGKGRFSLHLDGECVVASSREPGLDGCRTLNARGLTGKLRIRHAGTSRWAMQLNITTAAGLTVVENEIRGPEFRRWEQSPFAQSAAPTTKAVSCDRVARPAAVSKIPGASLAKMKIAVPDSRTRAAT